MKYLLIIISLIYSFSSIAQKGNPSILELISKEWHLIYYFEKKTGTIRTKDEIYIFSRDGSISYKDEYNEGNGSWEMNSDSTRLCYYFQFLNNKTYNFDHCKDFNWNIERLDSDSLDISVHDVEGTFHNVFSNKKRVE